MIFDLEKASALLSKGNTGVLDSIGMGFGVPNCLLNLTNDVLSILPSPILVNVSQSLQEGRESANQAFADATKSLFLNSGIIEFDTDTGKFRLVSGSSKFGLDSNESKGLKSLEALGSAMAYGSTLWSNYQGIEDQIDEVSHCIGQFKDSQKFSSGNSANVAVDPDDLLTESGFEASKQELTGAVDFINDSTAVINNISNILYNRSLDSALEPVFFDSIDLSGLFPTIASGSPITIQDGTEFFDLVFGPPKSKSGKFLLSVDGYYYPYTSALNVEVSNIHSASLPAKSKKYLLDFDPNLGGKGEFVSLQSIDRYFDTIFDITKIDDTKALQTWYDNDHFLQVIITQKDKNVYDLSGQVTEAIANGEGENSAYVVNLKQAIYGTIASHMTKINKRKKQIEIAVKTPELFGIEPNFNLGQVPINDFSYLGEVNIPISITKQRKLIFNAGDVSGVVLPYKPKFVVSKNINDSISISNLLIPPIGRGSIINSVSSLDASATTMLSLTEDIVTDSLISVYNFLEARYTDNPASTEFKVLNCAVFNMYGNAQLVTDSVSSVFNTGLGVPYLEGIGKYNPSTGVPSSIGSFIKLPDIKEFKNLSYQNEGFSLDFWTYLSDLDSNWGIGQSSSLHKIIMSCENTGGTLEAANPNRSGPSLGFDSVRGFVMGYTKDRQICSDLEPVDTSAANPVSELSFYIAPTQAINGTDITFINNTQTINNCIEESGYFKMSFAASTTVGGVRYSNASCDYIHIVVSVAPKKNEVKMYLDGILMCTSALSDVFGVPAFTPPQFPSFHSTNSFNYSTYSGLTNTVLSGGPKTNTYFSPFILGGGYTDGYINHGGFMGQNSGRTSGLKGHLGSYKIYSKALNIDEVRKNFLAQRLFFKNIDTPGCGVSFNPFDIDFTYSPDGGLIPFDVDFTGSSTYA